MLFDINHPAHVHVFKNVISKLSREGHEVLVTSRDKEFATSLLDSNGVKHRVLSTSAKSKVGAFLQELIVRDFRLYKVAKEFKPDVMVSVAGTFISHVGWITGIPSLAFYDTEDAKLQNIITYPFLTKLYVPECYSGWTPKNKTHRYKGYHELAYLSPDYFEPDRSIAKKNGIKQGKNIFVRLVSWQANHDIGYSGWSPERLDMLLDFLNPLANVIISSERRLPEKYKAYLYDGEIKDVHHVLAFCHIYIGESATMASEAAVLGVPSLYVSDAYRSYMNDLQDRFELVQVLSEFDMDKIKDLLEIILEKDCTYYNKKREALLGYSEDVTRLIQQSIEDVTSE